MNIICGIIVPRMLSPTAWNWGPKSGLFWGGISGLTAVYLLLRLPESKGRSYGELDLLFERRVPAWRFKSTKVDREYPEAGEVRCSCFTEFSGVSDVHAEMEDSKRDEEVRNEFAR